MQIIINNSSMVPIYEQLVSQIKAQIIDGTLKDNEALPSVRVFSSELRISALTVKKAYDKLEEEGFVVTVHGKGTYIAPANRELAFEARKRAVEEEFSRVIDKALEIGMSSDEIRGIVSIMLDDIR